MVYFDYIDFQDELFKTASKGGASGVESERFWITVKSNIDKLDDDNLTKSLEGPLFQTLYNAWNRVYIMHTCTIGGCY